MTLKITNETHWRTPDIRRLVTACIEAADGCEDWKRSVDVIYHTKRRRKRRNSKAKGPVLTSVSKVDYDVKVGKKSTKIILKLPKRGQKEIHSNPMIVIAVSAAAPGEGDLLSVSETFWMARGIAFALTREPDACMEEVEEERKGMFGSPSKMVMTWVRDEKRWQMLAKDRGADTPPSWADAANLLICKVKDPKLDGTYLAFVKKKTTALKLAETAIKTETKLIKDAQRRLRAAKSRQKAITKSLANAAERRV
jgi:hypothetical protein